MSDSVVDDAVGFISGILAVLGAFIMVCLIFANISGMLTMVVVQAVVQLVTPWSIPYWVMWGASIAISYQWFYFTERFLGKKYTPASRVRHYEDINQNAINWFNGANGLIGILYLVDCFYFKTGISSYCTKCFFGFFY
jgi:hypothetical protein